MADSLPAFKFRQWRLYAQLSQEQVAERMGVTKITVSRIERGERGFSSNYLIDFAKALGIPTIGAVLDHNPPGWDDDAPRKLKRRPRGSLPDKKISKPAREIRKELRRQRHRRPKPTPDDSND